MSQIVIKVLGGIVIDVLKSPNLPEIEVVILDYDNKEEFTDQELITEKEFKDKEFESIY